MFEIAHAENFPRELGRVPKKVFRAYKHVIMVLKEHPDKHAPPKIKRLKGYKQLWRLRVSDNYRLVYRVDLKEKVVTILMIGNRKDIYDRLGCDVDYKPGVRIVQGASELLEKEPTEKEVGEAAIDWATNQSEPKSPAPSSELPIDLNDENLTSWGVPSQYHGKLKSIRTEGGLLGLAPLVPEEVIEKVLNGIWPPTIEEVIQKPVRVSMELSDIEAAAEGEMSLEDFLLKLDDTQKTFVGRFEGEQPRGPWLLKGGPGSGKSTVALYCIQKLVQNSNSKLAFANRGLRILFTTFTKSLSQASHQLLRVLKVYGGRHVIDVKTVDSLAFKYIPSTWKNMDIAKNPISYITNALSKCNRENPRFPFSEVDAEFLRNEIDWVIVGHGLRNIEDYLQADRTGRGRALGKEQRRQAWKLFEVCQKLMRDDGLCLFSERLHQAERCVSPQYDYVFIDEAQDLKPVAIRFCIGLCKEKSNVFLTADSNQSIYGSGLSWSKVTEDLNFKGRARILRRNYRTTTEIWKAITQLTQNAESTDRETLDVETVYKGPYPVLANYSNVQEMRDRLNSYLHESLMHERLSYGCAAILCPTHKEMSNVIGLIDSKLNPKLMKSNEVNLAHPGIKVMTMHTAKGLQFPIVAVVGLEHNTLPLPVPNGIDDAEHDARQRRLFFVACSRAMRRLIVFANRDRPSPYVEYLTDECWDVE